MIPLKERFDAKWIPEPFSGCWLWTACVNPHGYGRILVDGKAKSASRISYQMHCGQIPPGSYVLHKCDTPGCVNPSHLFLGTQSDNVRDSVLKDRNGLKLSLDQVRAIRIDERSHREIARYYGVSRNAVWKTKNRLLWRYVR